MKAVVVDEPGHVQLRDREPRPPSQGEVLVEVAYAAICGSDHHLVAGRHPTASYPVVPGHEFSGTVLELGEGCASDLRVGSPVAIQTHVGCASCPQCDTGRADACASVRELGSQLDGGWQDYVTLPEVLLVPLPSSVSLLEAALLEPSANACAAVRAANIEAGEVVVVIGPGPIGLLAMQHARTYSPAFLGVVGLPTDGPRLEMGTTLGADLAISLSPETLAQDLQRIIGQSVDVIVQCAGSVRASALALDLIGSNGRVILEGYEGVGGRVELDFDRAVLERLLIRGVRSWSNADFLTAIERCAGGQVKHRELLSDLFPLTEYASALARSLESASGALKVAFRPTH